MSDSQRDYYDEYWARLGGRPAGYTENFKRWMSKELAGFSKAEEILEVGCGDALFTTELRRFTDHLTAIDISAEQVSINLLKHPDIHFAVHDLVQPMPFEADRFSAIWCSEVLEHLFDPLFALREMCRVLKPGGLLLVTVPYHGFFKNLCIALFKWDRHFDPEYPHIRFFTKNTLGGLATKAGFSGAS